MQNDQQCDEVHQLMQALPVFPEAYFPDIKGSD
jgi:hypothetical protein